VSEAERRVYPSDVCGEKWVEVVEFDESLCEALIMSGQTSEARRSGGSLKAFFSDAVSAPQNGYPDPVATSRLQLNLM
jgi:hypothetical protein